jgi:acyl-CoA reductase-like NAD-dependent aldehyde dehydrogenase
MATVELAREQLLIGGDWTDAASGRTYEQHFPYTPEMRVYSEESFGPLVSVIEVDGPDETVAVANDTEYGLSAAVFSENVPAALELAQRIESGICHINDTTVQDEPQMPFGGVKASGWGRFGGRAALEEFTELRWITVQELPRQYPI